MHFVRAMPLPVFSVRVLKRTNINIAPGYHCP